MARYVLISSAVIAILFGCDARIPAARVLRGNIAYGRGDYQTALVHYLVALDAEESPAWVEFNIGNVYHALGEPEAALEAWSSARDGGAAEAGSSELIFAASHNRGVLLFELGSYQAAYDEFRYALSVNSRSYTTKVNLELALAKLRAAETASQRNGAAGETDEPGEEGSEESLRILEYVRRKEARRWYANRDQETEEQPRDW